MNEFCFEDMPIKSCILVQKTSDTKYSSKICMAALLYSPENDKCAKKKSAGMHSHLIRQKW